MRERPPISVTGAVRTAVLKLTKHQLIDMLYAATVQADDSDEQVVAVFQNLAHQACAKRNERAPNLMKIYREFGYPIKLRTRAPSAKEIRSTFTVVGND